MVLLLNVSLVRSCLSLTWEGVPGPQSLLMLGSPHTALCGVFLIYIPLLKHEISPNNEGWFCFQHQTCRVCTSVVFFLDCFSPFLSPLCCECSFVVSSDMFPASLQAYLWLVGFSSRSKVMKWDLWLAGLTCTLRARVKRYMFNGWAVHNGIVEN